MIRELESYGVNVIACDPVADPQVALSEYGVRLTPWDELLPTEAVIVAVAHHALMSSPLAEFRQKVLEQGCFIDVKSQFDVTALQACGLNVWRL